MLLTVPEPEPTTKRLGDLAGTQEESLIQGACWLCNHLLLTFGRVSFSNAETPLLATYPTEETATFESKNSLTITPRVENGLSGPIRLCIFLLSRPPQEDDLEFQWDQTRVNLSKARRDLSGFLREFLAPLHPDVRHKILNWLATAISEHKPTGCTKLGLSLSQANRGLRTRLRPAVIRADTHRGIYIDSLFGLDGRSFYLQGWASVASGAFKTLTAVSPEGFRVNVGEKAFWYERPDVSQLYSVPSERAKQFKAGFSCYLELPSPSLSSQGWVLEAVDSEGEGIEANGPTVCPDIGKARSALIVDMAHEKLPHQSFRANHILPALTKVQDHHRRTVEIDWVRSYGKPPNPAKVSILIPLYRRTDFLEHQMAHFAADPELQSAEIIYLLDSPELGESLGESAAYLYELYRIPFTLAALRSNAGFAAVNNLGAGLAHGRLLLLLNSDVLPKAPGWLGRMIQFFDSKPDIGALGVKLLFEDETLQHAGVYFRRSPTSGLWENQHYFKGLDSGLRGANATRMVPALCGACMMIERDRYLAMSGLRGLYIQGDYEDSDFCLRLHDEGLEMWYLAEVELYHLEGQSYASQDRARNAIWNRWLHTHLWDKKIETLMENRKYR